MNAEERSQYNKDYRAEGFGREGDKRYRARWLDKIRAKDRARKAKHRRDGRASG